MIILFIIMLNGDVIINGNLLQGMGEGGGSVMMFGFVMVINDVKVGGKSFMMYIYGGVQIGGGNIGVFN